MAATTKKTNAGLTTPSVADAVETSSPAAIEEESAQEVEVIDFGESPPTPSDADLWLEIGRKWVNEGPASIRSAASALMTGLGALQGIYLGILGFAKFIPEGAAVWVKVLYAAPLLPWMIALYHCLKALMTNISRVNLNSPGDICEKYVEMIEEKQHLLNVAFWFMLAGLIAAVALVVVRLKM